MVNRLSTAHREQTRAAEQILHAIDAVRDTTRKQEARAQELGRSLASISAAASRIRAVGTSTQ
jgi:methyl-accepting chemotaxis protein